VRGIWYRLVIKSLYTLPGPDWPPIILKEGEQWVTR